jgi:excisionase family DNA binding protein
MQLMSIEDLAEYLGDSKRTIYKYIASGDCPPYMRISAKNIKFDRADVDAWLESKKIYPGKGIEQMSDLKMVNNVKEMIKNAIQSSKLTWTQRAQAVLESAQRRARKDSFDLVGTEHVLIGVVSVKECLALTILNNLGANPSSCNQMYNELCHPSGEKVSGKVKLSDDINKVVNCAYNQAAEWGHAYIGTEHLLIGILLAGVGYGFEILTALDVTLEKVREETAKLIVCKPQA